MKYIRRFLKWQIDSERIINGITYKLHWNLGVVLAIYVVFGVVYTIYKCI